jgi:hypothetical protein
MALLASVMECGALYIVFYQAMELLSVSHCNQMA